MPGLAPAPPELKRTQRGWSTPALIALGGLTVLCAALIPWNLGFIAAAMSIGAVFILGCRDRFKRSRAHAGAQRLDE
jgi:hypothetical protein